MELALVLAIVGVVAGLGLPLLTQHMMVERTRITRQNQERIFESLGAFLARKGYLPCPAEPGKSPLGEASLTCRKPGIVPFRTLGIEERIAKDGFGRFMTYAIDANMNRAPNATHALETLDAYCETVHTELSVKDPQGPVMDGQNKDDFVAVVLVSHGPLGEGAYQGNGKRIPLKNASSLEALNGDDDLFFADYPHAESGPAKFQHTVRWMSRNNLAASHAKVVCKQAQQFLSHPSQDPPEDPNINRLFEAYDQRLQQQETP